MSQAAVSACLRRREEATRYADTFTSRFSTCSTRQLFTQLQPGVFIPCPLLQALNPKTPSDTRALPEVAFLCVLVWVSCQQFNAPLYYLSGDLNHRSQRSMGCLICVPQDPSKCDCDRTDILTGTQTMCALTRTRTLNKVPHHRRSAHRQSRSAFGSCSNQQISEWIMIRL